MMAEARPIREAVRIVHCRSKAVDGVDRALVEAAFPGRGKS